MRQGYCHSDMLRIVTDAVIEASDRVFPGGRIEAHCDLVQDLRMDGALILRVFEHLEHALGVTLWPALAIDLVRAGPTVGRLARWMADRLVEADCDAV